MEINKENLENSLGENKTPTENTQPQMPKEMEIGFLQGALSTLAAERVELIKMIQNVEKIMGIHVSRLESLGVKVQREEPKQ